jgi:hypothetical protein
VRFNVQQRWFPRDPESPGAYEDASAVSRRLGRAVIADGVSSAMMSRSWARLLTRTAVVAPPAAYDDESLTAWVSDLQAAWWEQVDTSRLGWSGQEKLRRFGAQCTLMIVDVEPLEAVESSDDGTPAEYALRAHSIGDCCLFLVRDGVKILSFPMTRAGEFDASPYALSSKAKGVRYAEQFRELADGRCRAGDVLVLCTDAIAAWAMREYEAGRAVDWHRYRDDEAAWQSDIVGFRQIGPADAGNQLVIDDCTLLVLDIIPETADESPPDVEPDRSDEEFVLAGASAADAEDGDVVPGDERTNGPSDDAEDRQADPGLLG